MEEARRLKTKYQLANAAILFRPWAGGNRQILTMGFVRLETRGSVTSFIITNPYTNLPGGGISPQTLGLRNKKRGESSWKQGRANEMCTAQATYTIESEKKCKYRRRKRKMNLDKPMKRIVFTSPKKNEVHWKHRTQTAGR